MWWTSQRNWTEIEIIFSQVSWSLWSVLIASRLRIWIIQSIDLFLVHRLNHQYRSINWKLNFFENFISLILFQVSIGFRWKFVRLVSAWKCTRSKRSRGAVESLSSILRRLVTGVCLLLKTDIPKWQLVALVSFTEFRRISFHVAGGLNAMRADDTFCMPTIWYTYKTTRYTNRRFYYYDYLRGLCVWVCHKCEINIWVIVMAIGRSKMTTTMRRPYALHTRIISIMGPNPGRAIRSL